MGSSRRQIIGKIERIFSNKLSRTSVFRGFRPPFFDSKKTGVFLCRLTRTFFRQNFDFRSRQKLFRKNQLVRDFSLIFIIYNIHISQILRKSAAEKKRAESECNRKKSSTVKVRLKKNGYGESTPEKK